MKDFNNKLNREILFFVGIFMFLTVFKFTIPSVDLSVNAFGYPKIADFYKDVNGDDYFIGFDSYAWLSVIEKNPENNSFIPMLVRFGFSARYFQPIYVMLSCILVYFIIRKFEPKVALYGMMIFFINSYLYGQTLVGRLDHQASFMFFFLLVILSICYFKWWGILISFIVGIGAFQLLYNPIVRISYIMDKLLVRGIITGVSEYNNAYFNSYYLLIFSIILIGTLIFYWFKDKNKRLLALTIIFGLLTIVASYNERIQIFFLPLYIILISIIGCKLLKILDLNFVFHLVFVTILLYFFVDYYEVQAPNQGLPQMNDEIYNCAQYLNDNYENISILTWWDNGVFYRYLTDFDVRMHTSPFYEEEMAKFYIGNELVAYNTLKDEILIPTGLSPVIVMNQKTIDARGYMETLFFKRGESFMDSLLKKETTLFVIDRYHFYSLEVEKDLDVCIIVKPVEDLK